MIHIKSYPITTEYSSFEDSIKGSNSLNKELKVTEEALLNTVLNDVKWNPSNIVIQLSSGDFLHIFIKNHKINYKIIQNNIKLASSSIDDNSGETVFNWCKSNTQTSMDIAALFRKRIGSKLQKLWFNEIGFLVYTTNNLILWFTIVQRIDTENDIFYLYEDE